MHTRTLPEPLRSGAVAALLSDTLDWLDRAVADARDGHLEPTLFPLLFPAMFDDLFDELDHADTTRLALCDSHQASIVALRRALAGGPLDVDGLMAVAALSSWVRRLAAQLHELRTAGELFTVLHAWAVEQAAEELGTSPA
jgi:hypothetical protein